MAERGCAFLPAETQVRMQQRSLPACCGAAGPASVLLTLLIGSPACCVCGTPGPLLVLLASLVVS
jgi:hypothetical protein